LSDLNISALYSRRELLCLIWIEKFEFF
jgi:hypothetical protein